MPLSKAEFFAKGREAIALVPMGHGGDVLVVSLLVGKDGELCRYGQWRQERQRTRLVADIGKAGFVATPSPPPGQRAMILAEAERRLPETKVFTRQETDAAREEALRAAIERPETVDFWGRTYERTPVLVSAILGDGSRLLGVQPLNTRPNSYVVRVDSSWADAVGHEIDKVLEAVSEEFGSVDSDPQAQRDWPVLNEDAGVSWFRLDWPEGLDPAAPAAFPAPRQP